MVTLKSCGQHSYKLGPNTGTSTFLTSVSDTDIGIKCTLIRFADNNKLSGMVRGKGCHQEGLGQA